tara:strand:+ start:197 stop:400 length:204 start_codon:yes stop_codon:yes gene_type:complete
MKVKLKGSPVRISRVDVNNGKYLGIELQTWKAINRGEVTNINKFSKEAEEYLVSVEEKIKDKKKGDK